MCHNAIMESAEVVRALRGRGLTQGELARRAGIARETLSRWESGAQHPSLESLDRIAAAAGVRLEVQLIPAEPKLVEMACEQLDLAPTERLQALLGSSWPVCRNGLRAAAAVGVIERGEADVRLSTLSRYIEALGGRLEIRAAFPGESVSLSVGTTSTMRRRRTRVLPAGATKGPRNPKTKKARNTAAANDA
jgi:transcriptional regulator with XRE-family HTH domain